jgi:predicted SAM-dependent methyltransferase
MHEIDEMLKLQLEGRHTEARKLSDKLENIGPEKILDPMGKNTEDIWMRHCFNRGWFIIQEGDYQKGCQLLEHGRFLSVYGNGPIKTTKPIYNPKEHDIKGKTILIALEGGLGDEIIHARFITSFKNLGAGKVYLSADPTLAPLFSTIEGIDKIITRLEIDKTDFDYWIPGFSAGWVAGHTFDDFPGKPYIKSNTELVEVWKDKIKSDKIKVGIRWAGNPKFEHQQFRRFPEKFITNLKKYKELQLYSLQRDENTIDLPDDIIDLQHSLVTWDDTAAAIENLDLVITSCTSVAHLSAALGKETWVIVPALPYHTWTYKSPYSRITPYYDTVKLYRQTAKSKWNDTFQLLYKELEEKFNLEHVEHTNEDRITKRLNLGCGFKKFEGFTNVDMNPIFKPEVVCDLNKFPWPFEDGEFDHIVAKDILEHLGEKPGDLLKVIQELYRISHHSALWEIQSPHWRSDNAINDPDHKNYITAGMFEGYNQFTLMDKLRDGQSDSVHAFMSGIDIELVDLKFEFNKFWEDKINSKKITEEELNHALNHYSNVAHSVKYLIQVHKPSRIPNSEFTETIDNLLKIVAKPKENNV